MTAVQTLVDTYNFEIFVPKFLFKDLLRGIIFVVVSHRKERFDNLLLD